MKEAAFRVWLQDRGITTKSIATRMHAVRSVERHLPQLGMPHTDLDQAFAHDHLAALLALLRAARNDDATRETLQRLLMPDSSNPRQRLTSWAGWLNQYRQFRETENQPPQWLELEKLREIFLDRVPEFERFDHTDNEYERVERVYKDAMIADVRAIIASEEDDEAAGRRIFRALIPNQGPLLRWQTDDDFARKFPTLAPGFYAAIGRLARATGPVVDAMMAAADTFARLRGEGATTLTLGEIVSVAFSVAGMARPDQAVPFKISKAQTLAKRLTGDPIFTGAVLRREQVDRWLGLLRRIEAVMKNEWHWHPRDLLDVQGFAWAALDDKWKAEDGMDDEAVVARFRTSELFEAMAAKWTPEQIAAFCTMARAANEVGLDWYFTNMPDEPVRLGRKPERNRRAKATLGYLNNHAVPRLWMSNQPGRPQIGQNHFPLDADNADQLVEALEEHRATIAAWQAPPPQRPGRWPDEAGVDGGSPSDSVTPEEKAAMPEPINLILYGPPGTGKTYATAAHAVRLCDGLADDDPLLSAERRDAMMIRYHELAKDKRIEFVTFHQSMAYEEFVEGLRPASVDKDGQPLATGFQLQPTAGIFRKIAERAEVLHTRAPDAGFELGSRQVFKMSLGEAANAEDDYLYDEAMTGGYVLLGDDSDIDWRAPGLDSKAAMIDAFAAQYPNRPRLSPLSSYIEFGHTLRSRVRVGDLLIITKGNLLFRAIGEVTGAFEPAVRENGDAYRWRRTVRWLWRDDDGKSYDLINGKRFSQRTIYELSRRELKADAIESLLATDQAGDAGAMQPFVLVIDEINRANISKVFGELITLLETDKRIGAANALRVRLPYSGDSFGVPANLHIIGTMNTADRSIALLDTALRRRFTFEELAPDPDLPELAALAAKTGIDLPALLRTINDRIEYLFDRDHRLGHAYFLPCRTQSDVHAVMRNKVIPLLQEYFYEDWSKVAAVLGDVFEDDGKARTGGFLIRTPLASPFGDADEGQARYRWIVREPSDFVYARAVAAA